MKKSLSILFLAWLVFVVHAQTPFATVNTTTPHTNLFTYNGVFSVPGYFTNAPGTLTVSNNIYFGDTMLIGFGKVNYALGYIWSYISTISGGGVGGGISLTNGACANLTVTNPLTLVNPNPYYQITGINPTNLTILTNCWTGYFPTNVTLNALTNLYGFLVPNIFPPTCTNTGGVYSLNTNYPLPLLTNACGFMALTNLTVTNTAGPYAFNTNYNGVLTNAYGMVVITTGPCPNQNGPYLADAALGANYLTNMCGDILYLVNPLVSSTQFLYGVQSIAAPYSTPLLYTNFDQTFQIFLGTALRPIITTNTIGFILSGAGTAGANQAYVYSSGANIYYGQTDSSYTAVNSFNNYAGGGSYSYSWYIQHSGTALYGIGNVSGVLPLPVAFLRCGGISWSIVNGASPAPTSCPDETYATNIFTCWAMFQTNWLFCGATNVSFAANPPAINVTGSFTNFFSTANVPEFPSTNITTLASDGTTLLTFNSGVAGFWFNLGGNCFTNGPTSGNVLFAVFPAPAPGGTSPVYPFPTSAFPPYIVIQLGGQTKYLVGSEGWVSILSHQGVNFLQYNLSVDVAGNATVNLGNLTINGVTNFLAVKYVPWNSSGWSTTLPNFGPLMILTPPFTFY